MPCRVLKTSLQISAWTATRSKLATLMEPPARTDCELMSSNCQLRSKPLSERRKLFVSAKVARREHQEFATAMDLIDLAPPGLYEAVITDVGEDTANPELIDGGYLFRLERRTLADIRALGNNDPQDQLRFATAARVSEANLALYRNTLGPLLRAMTTEQTAETMRKLHPARLRFGLFSDENPLMQPIKAMADTIRAHRQPVSANNPLLAMERMASDWITFSLQAMGTARDTMQEQIFLATYGSPLLQALMGFGPDAANQPKGDQDLLREANEARLRAELEPRFETGGLPEAMIRSLIYIRQPEHSIDERGFTVAKAVRDAQTCRPSTQSAGAEADVPRPVPAAGDGSGSGGAGATRIYCRPTRRRRQEALADILRVLSAPGPMSERQLQAVSRGPGALCGQARRRRDGRGRTESYCR